MREIMFARQYPTYHPKAGMPTDFPIKMWTGFLLLEKEEPEITNNYYHNFIKANKLEISINGFSPKWHTIRALAKHHRWTVGEWFVPKVWTGKPYNSPKLMIGPPLEVKKVYAFKLQRYGPDDTYISIDGKQYSTPKSRVKINVLAMNDGFTDPSDFTKWFRNRPGEVSNNFEGQIICWNDKIIY